MADVKQVIHAFIAAPAGANTRREEYLILREFQKDPESVEKALAYEAKDDAAPDRVFAVVDLIRDNATTDRYVNGLWLEREITDLEADLIHSSKDLEGQTF